MLIHSLEVHGIKKFSSLYHFKFQPGLNIIYGPNESGKTTIQEIIFHLLYTNVNTSEAENQRSWLNKKLSQARLTYETNDQKTFRLTKDFLNKKAALEYYGSEGWTDLTDKKEQVNRLVKEHWGLMDKKIFNNTFFIKQKHLVGLDRPESLKLKDLLTHTILETDNSSFIEAEKALREQLEKIKGGVRSSSKGQIKQIEKKLSFLLGEQKKLEKYLQEEEQLDKLNTFLEQYKEKELILQQLTEQEKKLADLSGMIKELEAWERKIEILDKSIVSQAQTIGEIDLSSLQNWQINLNLEKKQQLLLQNELAVEREKTARIAKELERINQGVDDYIASLGEQSLQEIEKIEKLLTVEEQDLKQIKSAEKVLNNRVKLQKFASIVMLVTAFCLCPWKWWTGGVTILLSFYWFTVNRRRKFSALVQEREEFLQELQWRKGNILDTFFCQKREELEQQVQRYKRQEQETCLKMKELEFQREKIDRLEQQMNNSLEEIEKIELELAELYERTGTKSLTQLIMARKDYEKKLGEKRDWENKLWGKLGGENIETWRKPHKEVLQERESLLSKLEGYNLLPPLPEEELASKLKEKENRQEALNKLLKQINLCQSQKLIWHKQEFPSLNQLTGEISYWKRELQHLEEKAAALEVAVEVLQEAMVKIENQIYPQLEKAIREIFLAITNHHYDSIKVRENLDLTVYVRELSSAVDPALLSLGTLDQLYFALRIALGKVISQGKYLPFFLDDVLVNFDGTRRMKAMQVLAKMAKDQQIFLFTHDLQDVLSSYGTVIELLPFRLERRLEVS